MEIKTNLTSQPISELLDNNSACKKIHVMMYSMAIWFKDVTEEYFMSRNSVVRATVDEDVKKQAISVLATMGITMSDAVRILFTRIAAERRLPFVPLNPNSETLAAMQELENDDLESFDTVEELFEDLNA